MQIEHVDTNSIVEGTDPWVHYLPIYGLGDFQGHSQVQNIELVKTNALV